MSSLPVTHEEKVEYVIQKAIKGGNVTLVCTKTGTRFNRNGIGLYAYQGEEKIRQIVAETVASEAYSTIYLRNEHTHPTSPLYLTKLK